MPADSETRWEIIGNATDPTKFLCRCLCGTVREVNKKNLKSGLTRSCGCLNRERLVREKKSLAVRRTKHGKINTPEYQTWCAMKSRCRNKRHPCFADYGGRGISVCRRWDQFTAFYADMGDRPTPEHSIDRIDNNGGYWCGNAECPECGPRNRTPNCRWGTEEQQQRNRRNSHNITHDGRTQCLTDWAREYGIPANTLERRLSIGWDFLRAVSEPIHKKDDLTPDAIAEIRRRYDKGSFRNGGPALAREFNVSTQTIFRIVNNEIRKYDAESG